MLTNTTTADWTETIAPRTNGRWFAFDLRTCKRQVC
jgi:hypothetical protein